MKKYKVTVNGTTYEVEVELMDENDASFPEKETASPAPALVDGAASLGGETVKAPMTGTILSVSCENGKKVKKGDVIFVLEAMKMENEIMAPCDGTVSSVSVSGGTAVETGDLLCRID